MSDPAFSPLLPDSQTRLEGALAHATQAMRPAAAAAAALVQTLQRPAQIPPEWLAWLAWDRDVAVWPRWLDTDAKRALLAASYTLHKRAGTVDALRRLARVAAADLTAVATPRTRTFAGPSLTVDEREAFLARYPQLRIYSYRTTGQRRGAMWHRLFISPRARDIPTDNGARARFGDQAFLYHPDIGAESPLATWTEIVTASDQTRITTRRVAIAGAAGKQLYLGATRGYMARGTAGARIYSVPETQPFGAPAFALHRATLQPGLEPAALDWRTLAVRASRRGMYCGDTHVSRAPVESTAYLRFGRMQYLFDPARTLYSRRAVLFVGAQRLRFPPFTAELGARQRSVQARAHLTRFVTGHLCARDKTRYRDLLTALAAGTAARDKTLLNTRATRVVTAKRTVTAGSLLAGAHVID